MSKEKNKLVEILDKGFADLKAMISGPKNMATVTLEDGSVVIVGTESEAPTPEEMVGSSIVKEDGAPVEDGQYKTAEGVTVTVEGGVVTAAEAGVPEEPEDGKKPDEVEELKAKIAELEAALAAKDEAVVEAESKVSVQDKTIKQFKAQVEKLEAKYNELKNITVGDANPPVIAPQAQVEEAQYDPMAEDLRRYFEGRGIKFN